MPSSIVGAGQEKYWERAKKIAEEQGRANDYAYITGVFKKMTVNKGVLAKSYAIHPYTSREHIPGQVPSRNRQKPYEGMRLDPEINSALQKKPPAWNTERYWDKPMPNAQAVVKGLGLSSVQENNLGKTVQKVVDTAANVMVVKRDVLSKMLLERYDPQVRNLVTRRAVQLFQSNLQKSGRPEIYTPEELQKSQRAPEKVNGAFTIPTLQKGGEGSRGGEVIGHTAAGTPIYASGHKHAQEIQHHTQLKRKHTNAKQKDAAHAHQAAIDAFHVAHQGQGKKGIAAKKKSAKAARVNALKQTYALAGEDVGKSLLQKAKFETTGGTYHKRVSKKDDKGKTKHTYYYDEKKYQAEHGTHTTGQDNRKTYLEKTVGERICKTGSCPIGDFADLVKKYGAAEVTNATKSYMKAGKARFKKGVFYAGDETNQIPGSGRIGDTKYPGRKEGDVPGDGKQGPPSDEKKKDPEGKPDNGGDDKKKPPFEKSLSFVLVGR